MKATFIAGPCVIESAELLDIVAAKLVEINQRQGTDIKCRGTTQFQIQMYLSLNLKQGSDL